MKLSTLRLKVLFMEIYKQFTLINLILKLIAVYISSPFIFTYLLNTCYNKPRFPLYHNTL